MRSTTVRRVGALLLGLSLVAAACGGDDDGATDTTAAGGATETTAGSGEGGVTCDKIALGFFGALTGDAANLGINIRKGAELAVAQFNEANPNCQVELKSFDSQGSPDQAPALAKSAVDDSSIVGIIGPAFSGESRAALPLFEEAGLPIITPSATNPGLSQNGWKVFHRGLASDAEQGPAAAKYIKDTAKATKVFVIDDASDYGKGIADIVRKDLGSLVIGNDTVQQGQTDFAATVTKVKDAAPDAIFFGGYYTEAGLFVKQLRDAGVKTLVVAGDGVKDPGFIEAAGAAAAEGVITTCPCAPPENFADFTAAYKAKFGEDPQTYGAEAYDAASVFLAGIAAGKTDRSSLLAYIESFDGPGVTKQLKWDETGEVADTSVYAYEVKGGKIVGVGPIK